jgi:hypothetical protein
MIVDCAVNATVQTGIEHDGEHIGTFSRNPRDRKWKQTDPNLLAGAEWDKVTWVPPGRQVSLVGTAAKTPSVTGHCTLKRIGAPGPTDGNRVIYPQDLRFMVILVHIVTAFMPIIPKCCVPERWDDASMQTPVLSRLAMASAIASLRST